MLESGGSMNSNEVLREAVEWMQSGGNPQQVNWQAVKAAVDVVTKLCPCGLRDCCKRESEESIEP